MAEEIVPVVFRKSPEYILSYNFVDYISKIGYINLYVLGALDSSAAVDYIISPNLFPSYIRTVEPKIRAYVTAAGTENTGDVLKIDKDIDFFINKQIILNGKVIIKFPGYAKYVSDQFSIYWIVKVRKWDGTIETDLGSAKTETIPSVTTSDAVYFNILEIPISNKTLGYGEYLRVTIEGYVSGSANAGSVVGFWHDPEENVTDSNFIISIPIKMEN